MRITALDDDPGRKVNPVMEQYAVFLYGVEVKHVFTADSDKGEVIAAVLDSQGDLTAENGEVKRETLFRSCENRAMPALIPRAYRKRGCPGTTTDLSGYCEKHRNEGWQ